MPTRAQDLRNRIGGRLRQDPGADVTDLRRNLDWIRASEELKAFVRSWGPPTPEEKAAVRAALSLKISHDQGE